MPLRIEDYAVIGDCESAALVGRDGSIDWLCWPRFDSDACFAALLGTPEHGRFRIAPRDDGATVTRRYRPHTLILETRFETADGAATLIDFMPIRGRNPDLVRIVSDVGQNLAVSPKSALVTANATPLAYDAGDANALQPPFVVAEAYTNNFAGSKSTTLYGLDTNLDVLVRQGSIGGTPTTPNSGVSHCALPISAGGSSMVTRSGSSSPRWRSRARGADSPSSSTTSLISSIVFWTCSIAPPRVKSMAWRIFARMFWRCIGSSVAKLRSCPATT